MTTNTLSKHVFSIEDFNLWYGNDQAIHQINMEIPRNEITAVIGPSGCGKSTLLKTLNRMIETIPSVHTSGSIKYNNQEIFAKKQLVEELRTHVGMVFQKPNPFPKSIYENVAYGPKIHGIKKKKKY